MAMSEELEVLKELARRLDEIGIAYMVTGSTVGNFYAVPRMTRDIDIVVELSDRDIGKFVSAFEKDYYLEPKTVRDAVKTKGMFNLIHDKYLFKVDFVVRKDAPYRRKEFSRRKKVSVDGQDLYVVTSEDLILSKLEWAKDSKSEFQFRDVQNLLQSVRRLDRRYLSRWRNSWGCIPYIRRPPRERHLRSDGAQIPRYASQALKRGAPQDGLLYARDGASAG
jgi:hypothetical protein